MVAMPENQNVNEEKTGYAYYAFISYKHEDVKAAKWLQRKLQNYRLPSGLADEPGISAELFDEDERLPERLSPVFRDQTDLTPGNLGGSLKKALTSSRYLIVICSKAAHDSPEYLNYEIEHFLATGHTIDHVIPFIIDKESEHPELDCFPPALQELTGYDAVLGANVKDNGRNNAFLKVVATMLGVQLSSIKNLDNIRKRRHRAIAAAFCCLAIVLGVLGGVYYNKTFVPKVKYYTNYIEVDGVAEGVYELSADEISNHANYYAITTVNGIVQKVEYLNCYGNLADYDGMLENRYPTIEYIYRDKTILYQVNCYNTYGFLEMSMQFDEERTVVQLHSSTTSSTAAYGVSSLSEMTLLFGKHANITRYIYSYNQYNDDGLLRKMFFAAGDDNTIVHNGDDIYGYAYTYDNMGQVSGIYYLGVNDTTSTSPAKTTGTIDSVNSIRFTYRDGVISWIEYYDVDDNLILGPDGWAICVYTIDENGNYIGVDYYGEDQRSISCSDGYATAKYTLSGALVVKREYFDESGNRTLCSNGYAIVEAERSETTGYVTSESYYDVNGDLTLHVDGYASATQDIYDDGSLKKAYYDLNGNLTDETSFGYAISYSEIDENGFPKKSTYMDADGNVLYIMKFEYDGGLLMGESYYNEDGTPYLNDSGYSSIKFTYDSRGSQTGVYYYGTDGELCDGGSGYAVMIIEYDDYGNMSRFQSRDANNKLIGHVYGFEYDENGYISYFGYCNDAGELVNTSLGYAATAYERTYSDTGYTISLIYYNASGYAVEVNGIAGAMNEYDLYDNLLSDRYFDTSGNPCLCSDGYYRGEYAYDDNGNLIEVRYYDIDGKLCMTSYGYAVGIVEFDDNGNQTHYEVRDENNELVDYIIDYEYDEYGNCILLAFCDDDGMAVSDLGYAMRICEYTYTDTGYTVETWYLDNHVSFTISTYGYAISVIEYDLDGNIISATYYDENQQEITF